MKTLKQKMVEVIKKDQVDGTMKFSSLVKNKNMEKRANALEEVENLASFTSQLNIFMGNVSDMFERMELGGGDEYSADIQEVRMLGNQLEEKMRALHQKYNEQLEKIIGFVQNKND